MHRQKSFHKYFAKHVTQLILNVKFYTVWLKYHLESFRR